MYNNEKNVLMASYLESKTAGIENQKVLKHLMNSERDRHIMNLAAAGLQCMQWQEIKAKR